MPAGIVADNTGSGLSAQLAEVWESLIDLGRNMSDEEWRAPTPCPGWSVADQYAHMIGTESMLLGRPSPQAHPDRPPHVRNDIGGFNEAWVLSFSGRGRQAVLAEFVEITEARRAALAKMSEEDFSAQSWTPVGQADYRRFMQIRVFDCWVHEQDIRFGIDRPGHDSGPAVEQSVDEIVRAIGFIVGKKAGAPEGSGVLIRLTGPVTRDIAVSVDGKARAVEALAGEPTATVELSSTAFTRLACGRVDPEAVIAGDLGGVTMSGDPDLALRVATNMAFTI